MISKTIQEGPPSSLPSSLHNGSPRFLGQRLALRGLALACFGLVGCRDTAAPQRPAESEPSPPTSVQALGGAGPLPDDSVFAVEPSLVDQEGDPFILASLRGQVTLVTFFYSRCTTMCPLVIGEVRAVEALLTETERERLQVLLVSIDPQDSPETLRALASERGLSRDRYTLVRGDPPEVRTLAATLGMTYRPTRDDGFAHSALFTVLDAEGRIALQHDGLGTGSERIRDRIRALLSPAPTRR